MKSETSSEVRTLIKEAEGDNSCLVVHEPRIRAALSRKKSSGDLVSPARGLYARPGYWAILSPQERCVHKIRALHELHPNWVFCGVSAATLWGIPVPARLLGKIHILIDDNSRGHDNGAIMYHSTRKTDLAMIEGIPVTTLEQSLLDCLCWNGFEYGLAIADAALRQQWLSEEELVDYVERAGKHRHGIKTARITARHASSKSRSLNESIARAVMWELGFAAPELQVNVILPRSNGEIRHFDYHWQLPGPSHVLAVLEDEYECVDDFLSHGPTKGKVTNLERASPCNEALVDVVRFSTEDVDDKSYLYTLLSSHGVPRDHEQVFDTRTPRYKPRGIVQTVGVASVDGMLVFDQVERWQ